MVTITSFAVRETKDGRSFITLELSGGVEFVVSQATGRPYATTRRCSIPCTFDEITAQGLVGSQIPGEIVKQETEPYEFINKVTGDVMLLSHTYSYQATPQSELIGDQALQSAL